MNMVLESSPVLRKLMKFATPTDVRVLTVGAILREVPQADTGVAAIASAAVKAMVLFKNLRLDSLVQSAA